MKSNLPAELQCIKDKIKEWIFLGGDFYLIKSNNSILKEFSFKKRPMQAGIPIQIPFGDKVSVFTGIVEVVDKNSMNATYKDLYRKLKNMETQLNWSRFMRKPYFGPHHTLETVQSFIPSIRVDNTLSGKLNSDKQLISLIKKIQPDNLSVTLSVVDPEQQFLVSSKEDFKNMLVAYYEDPKSITWIITLEKAILRDFFFVQTCRGVYDILERVAVYVYNLSREMK